MKPVDPPPRGRRFSRRSLIRSAIAAAATATAARSGSATPPVLTPEMFGAKGDGRTNDTAAFDALSRQVNRQGGGTVVLRRTVYIVGQQTRMLRSGGMHSFAPSGILYFVGCSGPVVVEGNGATLRCAAGLRYGTFDAATGEPVTHPMPWVGPDRASPYEEMIRAERCTGSVTILDLELDGNLMNLRFGGPYGDTGYQIAASGILLVNNRGDEILRNIYTHHHALDGLMIAGLDDLALAKRVTRRIESLRSEYNGRQGCSIVSGAGYAFSKCKFNRTGRSAISSPPAAGVDIEAEGGRTNRDLSFTDCEFVDNAGCGMVADSGPSEGATFTRCRFIGTTAWSAWPRKPRFSFHSCMFVGALCQTAVVTDMRQATTFVDCTFLDDPAKSPTGKVYLSHGNTGAIADLNEYGNPVFIRCRFMLTHNGELPWSIRATYRDCTMSQKSPREAYPRGIFEGRNTIHGKVDLYGSTFRGKVEFI